MVTVLRVLVAEELHVRQPLQHREHGAKTILVVETQTTMAEEQQNGDRVILDPWAILATRLEFRNRPSSFTKLPRLSL
jgi:hypothetical protein